MNSHFTEYSSQSVLRRPKLFFRRMFSDLVSCGGLAWQWMRRDIRVRHSVSFFGLFWVFVPPLVATAVFTWAHRAQMIHFGDTDLPYFLYVMLNVIFWQTFVEAVNGPVEVVHSSKMLLVRVNFTREALVLAKIGEIIFNFLLKAILLAALFVIFKIPVTAKLLLVPLALSNLILLGTLVGLFFAPIVILYQDVPKLLSLITAFWFFLTPIIYTLPESGLFSTVVHWNPVTPLLTTAREFATTGILSHLHGFLFVSIGTFLSLFLMWVTFRVAIPIVVERVGS